MLKIGEIKSTCGCTVFSLDKKEYGPGETGIIKITYTTGKFPGSSEKHIFVPTNDKTNPNVKLTIKATIVRQIEVTPIKLGNLGEIWGHHTNFLGDMPSLVFSFPGLPGLSYHNIVIFRILILQFSVARSTYISTNQ